MNCSDIEKKWQEYLDGTLSGDEEEKIEAHIKNCTNCNKRLNRELENEPTFGYDTDGPLDASKEARILKRAKWKSRISNAVSAVLLVLAITILSGFLSGLYYGLGEPNRVENAVRVSQMVTELTMPNVFPRSGGSRVKTFFRMESSFELQKQIGREQYTIGHLETKMIFDRMNVVRKWANGSLDLKLYFVHPEGGERSGVDDTWGTLEILPAGTVSEMAVSFDKLYSLDEVYGIFSGYDVDLLWFPVDTGVETDQGNGPLLSVVDNLMGLPQFAHTLEYEPGSGGNFSLQDEGDSEKKEAAFIRGLEFLLEHENWAKKAYRGREEELMLKERLDYVQKNGLKVYGAVITGPTKELLRLKGVKEIKYPVLGETTWWNWQARHYQGTIRN
ncbi:MAG: anti-sigma factor [Bacillota bacterium]